MTQTTHDQYTERFMIDWVATEKDEEQQTDEQEKETAETLFERIRIR
jgi:hypothetical protein